MIRFYIRKYSVKSFFLLIITCLLSFQLLWYFQINKPHFFFTTNGVPEFVHFPYVSTKFRNELVPNYVVRTNRKHLPTSGLFEENFGDFFQTFWYFISPPFFFEGYGNVKRGTNPVDPYYNTYKIIENFCTSDNFETVTLYLDDCSILTDTTHEIPVDYGWLYGTKYLLFNRDVIWWKDRVTKQKCRKAGKNRPKDMCILKGNTVFSSQTFNVSHGHLVHFVEDVLKIPSISRNHRIDYYVGTRERSKSSRNGWQYGSIFSALGKPINVMTWGDDFRGFFLNGCDQVCFERGFFPNLKFQFFTNHQDAKDFKINARRLCGIEISEKTNSINPTISFINRRQGSSRRIGNYRELLKNYKNVEYYDDFPSTFCEQVELVSKTDVLIHPHGAGMINLAFLKEFAVVIEIYPQFIYKPCFKTMSYALRVNHLDLLINDPKVSEFEITKENQEERVWVRSVEDCMNNRDVCNLKILLDKNDLVVDVNVFDKYLDYALNIIGSESWWRDNSYCLELFEPTESEFRTYREHFENWWINNGENLYPCMQPITKRKINCFEL